MIPFKTPIISWFIMSYFLKFGKCLIFGFACPAGKNDDTPT